MTLQIYNKHNTKYAGTPACTIGVNFKQGLFTISKALQDLLDIKPGDFVSFSNDDVNTKEWYIFKDNKEDGLETIAHKNKGSIFVNSKQLAILAGEFLDMDDNINCAIFTVSDVPNPVEDHNEPFYLIEVSSMKVTSRIKPNVNVSETTKI